MPDRAPVVLVQVRLALSCGHANTSGPVSEQQARQIAARTTLSAFCQACWRFQPTAGPPEVVPALTPGRWPSRGN